MKRLRGAVVIIENGNVALIERINERGTYYLFPGGGVEGGETVQAAAVREAYEELGLTVRLKKLLCAVHFAGDEQHYFAARVVSGVFGTGKGEELLLPADSESGSYRPVWLPCAELMKYNVFPVRLAELISSNALEALEKPVIIEETSG